MTRSTLTTTPTDIRSGDVPDIYITPNGFILISLSDKILQGRLLDPFELCRAMRILRLSEELRKINHKQ